MLIADILVIMACLLAIPVIVFVFEVIAGVLFRARELDLPYGYPRQRVAILVPAHNESAGLGLTLHSIKAQLGPDDRLIVVADNCVDDTASVASAAGAEVIIRNDPARAGKGYALDFGIKHLEVDPPPIVIVIDADCKAEDGAIDELASACEARHRPAQAINLMIAPDESPIKYHVAEFAWRVKNWVRPSGLTAFGLPCQLTGTGMAFPWEIIRSVNLAHGSIVEDLKIGLDLALAGRPAMLCSTAKVTSQFPWSVEGAKSQRTRWEEGHVRTILTAVPSLLYKSITLGNLGLFALTLDLLVPPLSLLVILVSGMFAITGVAAALGCPSTALVISWVSLLTLAIAVVIAWAGYGRDVLPLRRLPSIATYVFSKLPIYGRLFSRRSIPWVRTDRSKASDVPVAPAPAPQSSIDP